MNRFGKSIMMIALIVAMMIALSIHNVIEAAEPKAGCPFHVLPCSVDKIRALKFDLDKTFLAFAKADYTAAAHVAFVLSVAGHLIKIRLQQAGCFSMLGTPFFEGKLDGNSSFISTIKTETVSRKTTACLTSNQTSAEWRDDPCCNPIKRLTSCCKERDVNAHRIIIDQFTDKVEKCCLNPDQTKAAIRRMRQTLSLRLNQCEAKKQRVEDQTKDFLGALTRCFEKLFVGGDSQEPCFTDDECSATCNQYTHRCNPPALDSSNAPIYYGKCVASELEPAAAAGFKASIAGKSTVDDSTLGAEIAKQIGTDVCVSKVHFWQQEKTLKTKLTCEAKQICNDGAATCANANGFCGFGCIDEGSEKRCAATVPLTESLCKGLGKCSNGENNIGKAACEAKQFCNHPAHSSATKADCEQKKICVGWPYRNSKCMKKASLSASGAVDACGTFGVYNHRLQMCVSTDASIDTEAKCTAATGEWVAPPDTEAKCLGYARCVGPAGKVKFMSKEECAKCSDHEWRSVFKTIDAKYTNGTYLQFDWVPSRKLYKGYKWVNAIDSSKAGTFVYKALSKFLVPRAVGAVKCTIDPYIKAATQVACDCGTKPLDTCFAPRNNSVAATSCFRGAAQVIRDEISGSKVSLSASSCSEVQDGTEIDIHSHTVISVKISKKRDTFELAAVDVKAKAGTVVGSVVGDGMSLTPAPQGSAELCLTINPEFKVSSSAFTKIGFVTEDASGEGFVYVEREITSSSDTQVCGKVSDDKHYYPSKLSPDVKDETTDGSSAASIAFNIIALVAVITVSMLMM